MARHLINVSTMVMFATGIAAFAGEPGTTPTWKPVSPLELPFVTGNPVYPGAEKGLTTAMRGQIYVPMVVPRKWVRYCQDQTEALEWPARDKLTTEGGAYKRMRDNGVAAVQKWVRLCFDLPELRSGILIEKGGANSYFSIKNGADVLLFRRYRRPLDISKRWPIRLEVVRAEQITETQLGAIIAALGSPGLSRKAHLKDIPKVRDALMRFPWNPKCINLSWQLRSFVVNRECKLVRAELRVPDTEAPLDMTVWIGVNGIQVRLHGQGLQHMPEFNRDGKVGKGFDWRATGVGPPGGRAVK